MLKLFKKVATLGVLALTMAIVPGYANADSPVLDRVIDFKVLKVGMSGNQPPMNTANPKHLFHINELKVDARLNKAATTSP